jgi:hypothetical protein
MRAKKGSSKRSFFLFRKIENYIIRIFFVVSLLVTITQILMQKQHSFFRKIEGYIIHMFLVVSLLITITQILMQKLYPS